MGYKFHRYCEMFPEIVGDEFDELVADIKANGLRESVRRYGGEIIDGKNRLRACEAAGVDPHFRDWNPKSHDLKGADKELLAFVISQNLRRRHLDTSQRAMVAAKLVTTNGPGQPKKNSLNSTNNISQQDAATALNVGVSAVRDAAKVIAEGSTELIAAVTQGEVSAHDAAQVAELPKSEQKKAINKKKAGKSKTVADAAKKDEPKPEEESPVLDELGKAVPKNLHDIFAQVPEWKKVLKTCSDLKSEFKTLCEHPASGYADVQEIERLIQQTRTLIKFAMPHTECPKCRRKLDKKCEQCKGSGWLTASRLSACASDADQGWLEARS